MISGLETHVVANREMKLVLLWFSFVRFVSFVVNSDCRIPVTPPFAGWIR